MLRAATAWDFPHGRAAPGEPEFAAAQRQVAEETGLADFDFPFGDERREALPSAVGKVIAYYLAETDEAEVRVPPSSGPGRARSDEWRWVSFDEAEELLPPRLALVLDWARAAIDAR